MRRAEFQSDKPGLREAKHNLMQSSKGQEVRHKIRYIEKTGMQRLLSGSEHTILLWQRSCVQFPIPTQGYTAKDDFELLIPLPLKD